MIDEPEALMKSEKAPRSLKAASWCAGVIDARASVSGLGTSPKLTISSSNEELLRMFRDRLGAGKIYGPYGGTWRCVIRGRSDWHKLMLDSRQFVLPGTGERLDEAFEDLNRRIKEAGRKRKGRRRRPWPADGEEG